RLGPAHSVTEIRMAAENVSSASREIAKGNTGLSTRTEEQASSIEETAASMEQISTTVKQNSESAEKANHLANAAADVATRGGGAVTKVVATMRNISESSKKIGDIVGVIDSLAFQTNILSLNAAVEAARAGEQGRGFAVVASEVRALAQRSAQAAKEIRALILESAQRVEDGVKQVESAGATMNEIVTAVGSVSTLITEIAHGSREQLAGIGQVNQAIMQIDGNTQESAAVVEEAAAAAEHLAGQAELLVTAVARFRLDGVEHESAAPATAEPQQRSGGLPGSLQRVASRLGVASPAALPLAAAAKSGEASWKEF
ncbi:MAG: hypothetical protein FJY56_03250, partial [Betaproteobacteria bacterium]|nr:hypothetical protein [Betaproteobacteria bacterium]